MSSRRRAARSDGRDAFAALGVAMVRHRRGVIAAWLLAVLIGLALLPQLLGSLASPPYEVTGSESARAAEVLGQGLPVLGNEPMLLVFRADRLTVRDPRYRAAVDAGAAALRRQPGVSVVAPLPLAGDATPPPILAETLTPLRAMYRDERNAYVLVGMVGDGQQRQDRMPAQRAAAHDAAMRASGGAVSAALLGLAAIGYELQRAEIADLALIEAVALPLALLVLLVGLRSPVSAVLPVIMAGAAVVTTLGLFALLVPWLVPDGMLLIGVNAIGLGVGIDYALFIVGRYREELAAGASREQAAGRALATTGRTACYSGLVVIVAVTSLLLVRWPVFTQTAVGAALVIVAAMAASLTLLPAMLAALTPHLAWRPLARRPARSTSAADGGWARWARHLMRHPWPYALVVTAVLLIPTTFVGDLRLGIDLERRTLADTPTGDALAVLEGEGAAGITGFTTILVQRPAGTPAPEVSPLLTALRAEPLVAVVTSLDNGKDLTALQAFLRVPVDAPPVVDLVHRIRGEIVPRAGPPGHPVLVGGASAVVTDIVDECGTKLWWVIAMVLLLLFGFLVLVLRSLLLPLKALAMNLLVTFAALGLVVVLFQRGAAERMFDFSSTGLLWAHIPILLFAVLFAVSMDYELFLVRRIQEDYRASGDNTGAVASGLQRTARPISLAAVIMVVAFGSLLVSRMAGIKAFGFGIAAAIAIDATLVRLVLVPALMQILGRWNWWLPFAGHAARPRRGPGGRPGGAPRPTVGASRGRSGR